MATWPRHTERFEQKYDKAFTVNTLFGAGLIDRIQKWDQIFLHSCNTMYPDNAGMASLHNFGELQRQVEQGEWIKYTPILVELLAAN